MASIFGLNPDYVLDKMTYSETMLFLEYRPDSLTNIQTGVENNTVRSVFDNYGV